MDVGCYCVSALRLLCGEPERVHGEAVARGGVDGRFAGVLRFPGDVLGTFDCGFDVPPLGRIEVVGEGGVLIAEDPWHGLAPRLTRDGEEVPVEAVDPYARELEDLSAAIRERRTAAPRTRGRARPGADDRSAVRRRRALTCPADGGCGYGRLAMTEVRLHVVGYPDSDEEERADLAAGLREEIAARGVEDVAHPSMRRAAGRQGRRARVGAAAS